LEASPGEVPVSICGKETEMIRKMVVATAVVLLFCAWTLSACHTVKGVGEDVESTGRAIERYSGK
jgi:entericidin B